MPVALAVIVSRSIGPRQLLLEQAENYDGDPRSDSRGSTAPTFPQTIILLCVLPSVPPYHGPCAERRYREHRGWSYCSLSCGAAPPLSCRCRCMVTFAPASLWREQAGWIREGWLWGHDQAIEASPQRVCCAAHSGRSNVRTSGPSCVPVVLRLGSEPSRWRTLGARASWLRLTVELT
jgi:hypothetical protein